MPPPPRPSVGLPLGLWLCYKMWNIDGIDFIQYMSYVLLPFFFGSMSFLFMTAGRCPKVVAAAQTLYDFATHSFKQSPDGMVTWPKKPSQKAMRARELKSNEKPEEIFATLIPVLASNNRLRSLDPLVSSKKPKLSMIESSGEPDYYNCPRRGPTNWSTPRSSRSSPNKSIKDSVEETKHSSASILKQSCSMLPPARVLDMAYNSHQKVRKILPMDWCRGPDGVD